MAVSFSIVCGKLNTYIGIFYVKFEHTVATYMPHKKFTFHD